MFINWIQQLPPAKDKKLLDAQIWIHFEDFRDSKTNVAVGGLDPRCIIIKKYYHVLEEFNKTSCIYGFFIDQTKEERIPHNL